jgi:hypothetical protein
MERYATLNAVVIGWNVSSIVKTKGYVASLSCELVNDPNIVFKVTFKNINAPRIDTNIKVKHIGWTKHGLPKYPSIVRPDRPDAECVKKKDTLFPVTLIAGKSVTVPSTSNPEISYTVKMSKASNSVYCSCPGWKYQKKNPLLRKCKHTVHVCGLAFIDALIANATLNL